MVHPSLVHGSSLFCCFRQLALASYKALKYFPAPAILSHGARCAVNYTMMNLFPIMWSHCNRVAHAAIVASNFSSLELTRVATKTSRTGKLFVCHYTRLALKNPNKASSATGGAFLVATNRSLKSKMP